MVALTGQAWDRETLRGAQRAARTQSEPPRWADCPWDPWVDLSTPQAQRGLLLHPGADLSRPQAQRGLPLHPGADLSRPKAHSGAASSLMGRSQWSPGPDKGCQPPSHADFLCYPLADLSRPQAQSGVPLHTWADVSRAQPEQGFLFTHGTLSQTHPAPCSLWGSKHKPTGSTTQIQVEPASAVPDTQPLGTEDFEIGRAHV